jgi:hypothetical protein
MKNKLIGIVVALVAMAGVSLSVPQTASAHMVGHVYCGTYDHCPEIAYANGHYWMTKLWYNTTWVRLTMVPGANNTHVAPITCVSRDSCVVVYYKPYQQTGYWMARQANGTIWVRLTSLDPAD